MRCPLNSLCFSTEKYNDIACVCLPNALFTLTLPLNPGAHPDPERITPVASQLASEPLDPGATPALHISLLTGQAMYTLSGGQKSRVAFAKMTFTKPHILLLDGGSTIMRWREIMGFRTCGRRAKSSWEGAVLGGAP